MYGNMTEFGRNIGNAYTNANVDHYCSVGCEITFLTPVLIRSNTVTSKRYLNDFENISGYEI